MFDKNKFANIIKNIKELYNSQEEFSEKSEIGRTYLSQYMNMKLDDPPKPKILQKLADASKGIISYDELMKICGYVDNTDNKELINLYNQLVDLEQKYDDTPDNLTLDESDIVHDLFKQILNCLNEGLTPATFNPYSILDDLDFISDKSRNKLASVLKKKFDYFYYRNLIENMIENITSNNKFNLDICNSSPTIKYSFFNCPVYGRISAGIPNWAEECLESYLPLDPNLMNINNPEECFFLRVNGESMNKLVRNGAYALIRKQDVVENGDIAVVLVNGYDATLKKFTKHGDVVVLEPMSDDPNFQTQIYDKNTDIKVLGRYLGKFELNN